MNGSIRPAKAIAFGAAGLAAFLLLFSPTASARQKIAYDPYSPALKYPDLHTPEAAVRRGRNRVMARLLEQPLRPVGHALGKTVEYVERKHLVDKTIWVFDELATHGIYPSAVTPTEGGLGKIGPAAEIDVLKLLQMEQQNVSVDLFGGWAPNAGFDGSTARLGAKYEVQIPGTKIHHDGLFRYWRSSGESFYGIGNETSLGEWSSYRPHEVWLEASLGAELTDALDASAAFVYQKMNIGNGSRNGIGRIKEHFAGAGIPGIDGGDLIGVQTNIGYDTRDHAKDPRKGGYGGLDVSYFHDTDGNEFQYVKVSGTAAHFIPVRSDRRVIALRLKAEQHFEIGGDNVPFYNLSRLGGAEPWDGSELLRSYRYNRFFDEGLLLANLEYRYSVYEYGDWQADAFGLFDIGEVYDSLDEFEWGELRFSYGGGVNIKFRRKTVLAFLASHGSEGLEFETNSKVSF